jgi:hypothetical protein
VAVAHYRYDHVTPLFLFSSIFSIYKQLKSKNILHQINFSAVPLYDFIVRVNAVSSFDHTVSSNSALMYSELGIIKKTGIYIQRHPLRCNDK